MRWVAKEDSPQVERRLQGKKEPESGGPDTPWREGVGLFGRKSYQDSALSGKIASLLPTRWVERD